MTDNIAGGTTTYGYDPQDRVTSTVSTSGDSRTYRYDANGNRISQTINGVATGYSYNAANELTTGPTVPSYDPNGNQLTAPSGLTAVYNVKNQTASMTPQGGSAVAFSYADANSTERTASGSTNFTSSIVGQGTATTSGSTTRYVIDNVGGLVAQNIGGTSSYYLFDALGSVVGMVGASGSTPLVASYKYDSYGQTLSSSGSGAAGNPWGFASGYTDITGLIKFGTRYYDPNLGRWTQPDPIGGSANSYIYTSCDPVNFVDPSGTFKCPKWLKQASSAIGYGGIVRFVHDVIHHTSKASHDYPSFLSSLAVNGLGQGLKYYINHPEAIPWAQLGETSALQFGGKFLFWVGVGATVVDAGCTLLG
jgi:RHS repeat-associated protein